jgi:hypothetical protein
VLIQTIPSLVSSHLRGSSVVRNDRRRSWYFWDSINGKAYQKGCAQLIANGKRVTRLFTLPEPCKENAALRKTYGKLLFQNMKEQRSEGVNVNVVVYDHRGIFAPEPELLSILQPCTGVSKARNLINRYTVRIENYPASNATCERSSTTGSIIYMIIIDDTYCQLKISGLPPCHTDNRNEVVLWTKKYDGLVSSARTDLEQLENEYCD